MKKLFCFIFLILACAVSATATQITVSASTLSNYTYGGSTATIRIYPNKTFVTSTSVTVLAGTAQGFYKTVNCSVSGITATCDSFTIDSTTDSNIPTVKYFADLYDSTGRSRGRLVDAFSVPTSLGTTITWEQIRIYNQIATVALPATFPTTDEVNALIATKQNALVSGATIKTVNSTSLLGAGDVAVQATLVSGTNIKTINSQSLLGTGDIAISGAVESLVSDATELDAAITAANANPSVTYNWVLDSSPTVASSKSIPSNVYVKGLNGSKFVKSGTGAIAFAGIGLAEPQSQATMFSGFSAGDITWTGSTWPAVISSSLWDSANWGLRVTQAARAFSSKSVKILVFPGGTPTAQIRVYDGQHLHFTRGTYENAIASGASSDQPNIILESNTKLSGDGIGITILKESASGVANDSRGIYASSVLPAVAYAGTNENIEVSDLTFLGQSSAVLDTAASAINLGNCVNCHAHHVKVKDSHGFGIYLGSFGTNGYWAENSSITNCVLEGLQTQFTGVISGKNILISDNLLIANKASAASLSVIDIEPNSTEDIAENIRITNNIIDGRLLGSTANGITVQTGGAPFGRNIVVSGNTIIGADDFPKDFLDADVTVATDQIFLYAHGLYTGQGIFLTTTGTVPAGLSSATQYYVIRVDSNHFKLATTRANADAGTAINITAAAGGGTHTVNPSRFLNNGIQVGGTTNAQVSFNVLSGTAQSAIVLSNSHRIKVFSNTLNYVGGGGNAAIQLISVADSDIQDNVMRQAEYNVNGDDSIVETETTMTVNTTSGSPTVTRTAGTLFYPWWVGRTVTINAVDYVIKSITNLGVATLTTNAASTLTGTTLTTKFSNNRYNGNKASSITTVNSSVVYSKATDYRTKGTVTIDPASINANTVSTQTFTLTGAATGDSVVLNPPTAGLTAGLLVLQVRVSAANTVAVTLQNTTGSPIDEASASWNYTLFR